MKEVVKTLTDLMKFRTTADNPAEILKCAEYIIKFLKGNGMVIRKFVRNGKVSVVASFRDTKRPQLILNAHFDVVPAMSPAFYRPRIKGNRLYGRGSEDCKGQVAVLMHLMKSFSRGKQRPDVAIMLTSDEEVHGKDGVEWLLKSKGYRSEFAIVADGGDGWDIVTRHKGVLQVRLSARGSSAHASRYWEGGDNAIEKLIEAYGEVKKIFPKLKTGRWKSTACLSKIRGGETLNQVPDYAELYLDIRRTEKDSARAIMRRLNGIRGVRAEAIASAETLETSPGNPYIRKLAASAGKVLGKRVRTHYEHGATDARYFSEVGVPAVLFKALGGGPHSEKEHVLISSIRPYFRILSDFVENSVRKIS